MQGSALSSLLAPLGVEQFIQEYWPERLYWRHDHPAKLGPLMDIPELKDVRRLVAAYKDSIAAYYPPDVSDALGKSGERFRSDEALAAYARGARLQLDQAQKWIPAIEDYIREVEAALSLPARSLSCGVFAAPPGAVVAPHFDTDPAFSVQIVGTKVWEIGRAPAIPDVLHNHVLGMASWYIADYHDGELPTSMPDDCLTLEMAPGSALYLPRGHVHTTRSVDHSISITIEMPVPTWVDVVTDEVRRRLSRVTACRAFVMTDGEHRQGAPGQIAALMPEIQRALQPIFDAPEALVEPAATPVFPGSTRRFRLREEASVRLLDEGPAEGHLSVSVRDAQLGESEIEVPPPLAPLCRWVLDRKAGFVAVEALSAAPRALGMDVMQLLDAFVETGVLAEAGA